MFFSNKKILFLNIVLLVVIAFGGGWFVGKNDLSFQSGSLISPFIDSENHKLPLLQYSLANLKNREYQTSPLVLEEVISDHDSYTAYLFSYTTLDKKMTGQLNLPKIRNGQPLPIIVMVRGYVPQEIYTTGTGTRNAAGVFASNGYVTIAPDFLGYGGSDPEAEDSWEARFQKPINLIELIRSVEQLNQSSLTVSEELKGEGVDVTEVKFDTDKIGIWAHSNGGQITLTALEALSKPIPTTLWAPVTAPFPYSVLFYGDELDDEGKEQRAWLAMFEKDYDARDFSLTQHLNKLTGPIQLHHGTADEAALKSWSDEFADKVEEENLRRELEQERVATLSAEVVVDLQVLEPINLIYHVYPGADHNLQPSWNTVVQRDLQFFDLHLGR